MSSSEVWSRITLYITANRVSCFTVVIHHKGLLSLAKIYCFYKLRCKVEIAKFPSKLTYDNS